MISVNQDPRTTLVHTRLRFCMQTAFRHTNYIFRWFAFIRSFVQRSNISLNDLVLVIFFSCSVLLFLSFFCFSFSSASLLYALSLLPLNCPSSIRFLKSEKFNVLKIVYNGIIGILFCVWLCLCVVKDEFVVFISLFSLSFCCVVPLCSYWAPARYRCARIIQICSKRSCSFVVEKLIFEIF